MPERYENFSPTPKNFRQPENFRLLQQLGGAAAPPSTPSNTPMRLTASHVCVISGEIFQNPGSPITAHGSGQELMAKVALLKLEYVGYVGQPALTVLKGNQYQTKSIRQWVHDIDQLSRVA